MKAALSLVNRSRATFSLSAGLALLLGACAVVPDEAPSAVTFLPEMEIVGAEATRFPRLYDFRSGHDAQPLEDKYALLGREDLTAVTHWEYGTAQCAPHASGIIGVASILDEVVARAADTRIVIVNESHVVSRHRDFSRQVAERLRPLGYTHFAAETFTHPADGPAPVLEGMGLPWPRDEEGFYSQEAAFGRLWRSVRDLGYTPVAYEENRPQDAAVPMAERIAARELFQAESLTQALEDAGPDAKFLIHVGYGHANETTSTSGQQLMAAWLRELTGIDPLTVSQYECRQAEGQPRLATHGPAFSPGSFDLTIDYPLTRFAGHRPLWRAASGDVRIAVPDELVPETGAHVIEARLVGEPDEAIPLDRVLVCPGEDVDLLLPPGQYRLRGVVALTDAPE